MRQLIEEHTQGGRASDDRDGGPRGHTDQGAPKAGGQATIEKAGHEAIRIKGHPRREGRRQ